MVLLANHQRSEVGKRPGRVLALEEARQVRLEAQDLVNQASVSLSLVSLASELLHQPLAALLQPLEPPGSGRLHLLLARPLASLVSDLQRSAAMPRAQVHLGQLNPPRLQDFQVSHRAVASALLKRTTTVLVLLETPLVAAHLLRHPKAHLARSPAPDLALVLGTRATQLLALGAPGSSSTQPSRVMVQLKMTDPSRRRRLCLACQVSTMRWANPQSRHQLTARKRTWRTSRTRLRAKKRRRPQTPSEASPNRNNLLRRWSRLLRR
jgi:hypothetical protein